MYNTALKINIQRIEIRNKERGETAYCIHTCEKKNKKHKSKDNWNKR